MRCSLCLPYCQEKASSEPYKSRRTSQRLNTLIPNVRKVETEIEALVSRQESSKIDFKVTKVTIKD